MSIYLSIYLSVCLSIYLSIYPSTYRPFLPSTDLLTHPSTPSTHLTIYLSTYLSIYLPTYLSIYPSTYPPLYRSIHHPSIDPSIYPSTDRSKTLKWPKSVFTSPKFSFQYVVCVCKRNMGVLWVFSFLFVFLLGKSQNAMLQTFLLVEFKSSSFFLFFLDGCRWRWWFCSHRLCFCAPFF